ncbi:choice-of-anchor Q domain-containing protein [Thermosulfurimonas dismutans]|uniref:Right handed beta helix domain-containing protein n=1 Tax=Thermosulfurimonas dismutans TaxID=999894 RepID=A0A179D4C3_9BACT|nr:choice-of-anchor Q domain-containing protein [Thermosulfurimonas dismutans]OAQ20907.1 hypothetical protein TDIS_1034 [Thermosulfurimonas dismutans]
MLGVVLGLMALLFLNLDGLQAATYYVRPDGGTAEQCTGLVDAPYPGEGKGQPCAWSHPFWALKIENGEARWRIRGGDTLVIHAGSYVIGYKAPNTEGWCYPEFAYDCALPPVPSGPDAEHPTRIVGYGWDSGCTNPPELWGTGRVWQILNLRGSSNVEIACLEITDHESCAYFHNGGHSSVACEYENSPFGDWAYAGIYASDSSNVTLRDLNIHGLGADGIKAGRLENWQVERVRIAGNGWSGWNGDLDGAPSSNQGQLYFKNFIVEWNGCVETYPEERLEHCWAQSHGGYGDGVGVARSGGTWIFEDSLFRYNTSDGLDLLYVGVNHPDSFITLRRVQAYGNAGNQLKVGGPVYIVNSIAISNCNYFTNKDFAQEMGDVASGDACRAGGAAISVSMNPGDQSYIINTTVVSEGWALIEVYCHTHDFPEAPPCNGSERLHLFNNIFFGYRNVTVTGREDWPDLIGDGDPEGRTRAETIDYNLIYRADIQMEIGSHNIQEDPLLREEEDINRLDAHLQEGSPAIDRGLPVGAIEGRIPERDLEGISRPQDQGVDLGAYEFREGEICTLDGDVAPLGNRDGEVNIGDALVALRFALGLETPSEEDRCHADVAPLRANGQPQPDGKITIGDALVILRKALGLVSWNGGNTDNGGNGGGEGGSKAGEYVVIAYNDPGMHCINQDYSQLSILPPFNTLIAQVIRKGEHPEIVTQGIWVEYRLLENTSCRGTNFWDYVKKFFWMDVQLCTGLTGKTLQGVMELRGDRFLAEGLPVTPFDNNGNFNPYPLVEVVVKDEATGEVLATTRTVVPVSHEMHCEKCHERSGGADTMRNILLKHDEEEGRECPPNCGNCKMTKSQKGGWTP